MTVFSVHLASLPVVTTLGMLLRPPSPRNVAGLKHVECLTEMTLGARVFSPARLRLSRALVFAAWDSQANVDSFLTGTSLGKRLVRGWHVRLALARRWGRVRGLDESPEAAETPEVAGPVVALTLARMKLPEVPRFIRWGRPVEALVRDHPGTTLAMGALRLPRTVATFSCWQSEREMRDMVLGHSAVQSPERHATAMVERERRDFHFEFTTLRFRPLSEHGEWEGRRDIVFGSRAQGTASLNR